MPDRLTEIKGRWDVENGRWTFIPDDSIHWLISETDNRRRVNGQNSKKPSKRLTRELMIPELFEGYREDLGIDMQELEEGRV